MGYSSRYHAASLAAVFLALAIGILIGAGLGGNVLNDTEDSLRKSLESDLSDARSQSDDLRASLERQREFATRAYPALVGDRLAGERVGVIALGDLPGAVSDDIEGALAPTGADFGEVSVVRTPPDAAGLAGELKGTAFAKVAKDPSALEALGRRLGRELAQGGGKLVQRTRGVLLARSSGEGQPLNRVILFRQPAGELPPRESAELDSLETGIVEGVRRSGLNAVAVETSDAEDSSVPFFKDRDVATVDDVDATAGRVAMVFGLLGASGDFGVKDTADRLLPELLVPPASTP
ncbi:MAG: copper transporter [Solirubrobacterales bacterium]